MKIQRGLECGLGVSFITMPESARIVSWRTSLKLLLLAVLLWGTGCGGRIALPPAVAYESLISKSLDCDAPEKSGLERCEAPCEVFLDAWVREHPTWRRERTHQITARFETVCVKRAGDEFGLPSRLYLGNAQDGVESGDPENADPDSAKTSRTSKRMCRKRSSKHPELCLWNNRFHDRFPISFRFRSASPHKPLSRFIRVVRVLRNGELAYTWTGANSGATMTDDPTGTQLTIRGADLRASLVPYRAEIDLRVVPEGIDVDGSILEAKVSETEEHWSVVLAGLRSAASDTLLDGEAREAVQCAMWKLGKTLSASFQLLGKSPPSVPPQPPNCSFDAPVFNFNLVSEYSKLKDRSIGTLDGLDSVVDANLKMGAEKLSQAVGKKSVEKQLMDAVEKAKTVIRKWHKNKKGQGVLGLNPAQTDSRIQKKLAELDARLAEVQGVIGGVRQLHGVAKNTAIKLRKEASQKDLYDAFVKNLQSQRFSF